MAEIFDACHIFIHQIIRHTVRNERSVVAQENKEIAFQNFDAVIAGIRSGKNLLNENGIVKKRHGAQPPQIGFNQREIIF